MIERPPPALSLDRSSEPWVGSFPGLGSVAVYKDGSVETSVDPVPSRLGTQPSPSEKDRALRFGWGEALSLVRQGYTCFRGSALVPADPRTGCLLLVANCGDAPSLGAALLSLGWLVMADALVPTRWDDVDILAVPRSAPMILPTEVAIRAGLRDSTVRAHSDSVAVATSDKWGPVRISGVVLVEARGQDSKPARWLEGHERLVAATSILAGGVLGDGERAGGLDKRASSDPHAIKIEASRKASEVLARRLRIAKLPMLELPVAAETIDDDVARLVDFWQSRESYKEPVGNNGAQVGS